MYIILWFLTDAEDDLASSFSRWHSMILRPWQPPAPCKRWQEGADTWWQHYRRRRKSTMARTSGETLRSHIRQIQKMKNPANLSFFAHGTHGILFQEDSPLQFLGTNFQHVTKHKNCFNDSGLGNLHEFKSWAFYFWPAWLIKLVGNPRWRFDSVQGDHRVKDDKRINHFLNFDSMDLRFLALHFWTIRSPAKLQVFHQNDAMIAQHV